MMDLPWLYLIIDRNWSRSSGRKRWASRRIGWFCAGRGKKDEEQRQFEADRKEIFSNCNKQAKAKAGESMDKKEGKGQSVRWKVWWRQSHIKYALREE